MSDSYHFTGDDVDTAMMSVDQFWVRDDLELDCFRHGVLFTWCDPAMLREYVATIIEDIAFIGRPFDDLHGSVFVSSVISCAIADDCGVCFTPPPPSKDDTVVVVGYSEGGVQIALGDGEAWDPTMWQLRFGPRGAA